MPVTVTMPQMGESVVEGTLERWVVAEAERNKKDQTICEMTTDKVDAERSDERLAGEECKARWTPQH